MLCIWISLNFISSLMSFCEPIHSLMSGVGGTVVVATGVSGMACAAGTVVVVAVVATGVTGMARSAGTVVVIAVVATGVTGTARGGGTAIVAAGITGTSGTA